jgi:hypothetical protein
MDLEGRVAWIRSVVQISDRDLPKLLELLDRLVEGRIPRRNRRGRSRVLSRHQDGLGPDGGRVRPRKGDSAASLSSASKPQLSHPGRDRPCR